MIVACTACGARFRVAEGKIGPRGARVRCSRCGTTFAVAPENPPAAPPPPASQPPAPPHHEPTSSHGEKTSTGGWPTGVLEIQGTPSMDAPASPSLAEDPFAAYAASQAPEPEPTPIGLGLPPPRDAAHEPAPGPGRGDLLGSLPVTALADLEKTASVPVPVQRDTGAIALGAAGPGAGTPGLLAGQDLSLEERTPAATPVRDAGARWADPEASTAVAIGPDGFQEVDLASSAAPPDPNFDHFDPEPTPVRAPSLAPTPTPRALHAEPSLDHPETGPAGTAAGTASIPAQAPQGTPQPRPARLRAFAMNVLSLAALLVVTAGILLWWRGGGLGGLVRLPGSAVAARVEVSELTSGVYGGEAGQPVVFVRGVVRAAHGPVDGPVLVRVDLVRGGQAVGSTTTAAGALPWPEELAALATVEDVERLRSRTASRAAARLEPGAGLPFLAFLPQPPGDAAALSYRVEPLSAAGR